MATEENTISYYDALRLAKRYDEAKINGSRLWECGEITRENYEYMFPELKESEDERIRQFLIQEVTETSDEIMSYRNMNKEDVLAWLEKQGEHANFRNKIQIGDKVTRNEAGILVNISQLNRVAKPAQRQSEQKPTGEEMKEALRTEYEKGRADAIAEMQKPAWSEEDEKKINYLIALLQNSTMHNSALRTANEGIEKWLKSIKDRVQPKVELTQLDKNILEAAIAFVEQNNHFNCWRGVDKHTVLSALHSLKPQTLGNRVMNK